MSEKLLQGFKWSQITREERFFCARLYALILEDEARFVQWLKDSGVYPGIDLSKVWEVGYEVCFYRDYWYWFKKGESSRSAGLPSKRTFDLALFADDEIIIIEAKAHEVFGTAQVNDIRRDREIISREFGGRIKMKCLALATSGYFLRSRAFHDKWLRDAVFDGYFSWADVAGLYGGDPVLRRADMLRDHKGLAELIEASEEG